MARRANPIFIGADYLTLEGREIKHPGLIKVYATPNMKKVTDVPMQFVGLDLETEATTSELRLLGFWDGHSYKAYYKQNFLEILFMYVRACRNNDRHLAYWNRLDPFVLFKQFLVQLGSDIERNESLKRFGHISGDYDVKNGLWKVNPVVKVYMKNEGYEFGIIQAIRSSVQFFYNRIGEEPTTVWAYDIAALYENGLEKEATSRLPYYSKVDQEAHIVDWSRFETDLDYRKNIVLKSNELDARAVYDLAHSILKDFSSAFYGYYPRSLVSQGTLARAAVVADHYEHYKGIQDETHKQERITDDISSIGILYHLDTWAKQLGNDSLKDFYMCTTEAYSGGYIEAIRYGYASEGWYADIASAYPGVIQHLYDLRGSVITQGAGIPPKTPHSYVFIRGMVHIPKGVNFHPITVKHPLFTSTNIRATGDYRASYLLEEREFLESQGATFTDEIWWHIQTEGKLSPLARVCLNFIELRKKFKAMKSSSQHMAKIAANSLYGILFEAVHTYDEFEHEEKIVVKGANPYRELLKRFRKGIDLTTIRSDLKYIYGIDGYQRVWSQWHKKGANSVDSVAEELKSMGLPLQAEKSSEIVEELQRRWEQELVETSTVIKTDVHSVGYRAGEFWNPVYASIITGLTRVLMARAASSIEKNGGKVIIMMTDSILWQGRFEDMPGELWREVKTLGYFEKPSPVKNIVALGSGRYQYEDDEGEKTAKRRGLNASEIHASEGIIIEDDFDWMNAIRIMEHTNKSSIDINVRTLISPGVILGRKDKTWRELGLVEEQKRNVCAIVGRTKRFMRDEDVKNPKVLANGLVDTTPLHLRSGMNPHSEEGELDQTLPQLRKLTMEMEYVTKEERRGKNVNKAMKKNYEKNKERYARNYERLRGAGVSSKDARRMCKWSDDRIMEVMNEHVDKRMDEE